MIAAKESIDENIHKILIHLLFGSVLSLHYIIFKDVHSN